MNFIIWLDNMNKLFKVIGWIINIIEYMLALHEYIINGEITLSVMLTVISLVNSFLLIFYDKIKTLIKNFIQVLSNEKLNKYAIRSSFILNSFYIIASLIFFILLFPYRNAMEVPSYLNYILIFEFIGLPVFYMIANMIISPLLKNKSLYIGLHSSIVFLPNLLLMVILDFFSLDSIKSFSIEYVLWAFTICFPSIICSLIVNKKLE